jgi:hypothetical protein
VSKERQAEVRFYFDADVLGLAQVVGRLRLDATYPGDPGVTSKRRRRPACIVTSPAVKDPVWIPQVAEQGWLIITRDRRIQHRPAEINAVLGAGAKLVTLASADAGDTWAQLEVLMCQWRGVERLANEAGPFIWTATRSSLKPVRLS